MIIHKIDSPSELSTLINSATHKPLILHFYTEWCGPCKVADEEMNYYATNYKDKALYGKIDCDESEEIVI